MRRITLGLKLQSKFKIVATIQPSAQALHCFIQISGNNNSANTANILLAYALPIISIYY